MARRGTDTVRRRPGRSSSVAILVMAAALAWLPAPPVAADTPTLGGPFELTDQNGVRRTDADFHGFYPIIYFGFTHCPDLCPTTLSLMGRALDALAEQAPAKAARVVPIFITVDPERDTVELLHDYVASFHPRLVGLTGTPAQVDHVARNYGAFYAPVPIGGGDYLMDHSGFILLMGPEGDYVTHFESDVTQDELVEALAQHVAE